MDISVFATTLSTLPPDDDHPYRTGPWRPQTREFDAENLDVEGELPRDLSGVYLRNTENPVHPALVNYHPFDGDGMVHMTMFRDGQATYRNRFVKTDGFRAEQAAGGPLWAGIAENPARSIRRDGWGARGLMKDASSTDVVVHAGVAVTSFWQCGDLYRLDPMTLEELGKESWGGAYPSDVGVSAHTKVDEHTGELLFFNYSTKPPFLHYGVVDAARRLVHYVPIDIPGARLPHDMTFTENFAILNDLPLFWDPDLIKQGHYVSRLHRELPSRLGVIPRRGDSASITWFDFDPTYVLHWTNAWEDGGDIVVEGFFQGCPEPKDSSAHGPSSRMFRFLAQDVLQTRLHRWRMNLATGSVKEEDLTATCSEFGVINAMFAGRPSRYVYAATNRPGWFLFDGFVKHDTQTGSEVRVEFNEGVYCSEIGVAPKVGKRSEDDVYLVTYTIDMNRDRSDCVVYDGADIAAGPVATVRLPERLSSGTHSCWAQGSSLAGW